MKKLLIILSVFAISASCSSSDNGGTTGPDGPEPQPGEVACEDIAADYTLAPERSAKRGVSFNFQYTADVELLGDAISWFYNWGPDVANPDVVELYTSKNIDFFPMAWNGSYSATRIRNYKATHPECDYLLAFNEPNLTDQARMTPSEAAALWPALRDLCHELGLKVIAPAMNYGTLPDYSDPIKWLDEFFTLVPVTDFDGLAIHCYMGSAQSLKSYVRRFYKYDLPIWMTEFCAWEQNIGNYSAQMRFMCDALSYMEADSHVERYAWFMPRGSNVDVDKYPFYSLLTKTQPFELTPLGRVFCAFPAIGSTTTYAKGEVIPAERFFRSSATVEAENEAWAATPQLRPTTDNGGVLEVYNFLTGQWLDYNISIPTSGRARLYIRYAAYLDSAATLTIGNTAYTVELPSTGDDDVWTTAILECELSSSAKTLRIEVDKGILNVNWFMIR